MQLKNYLRASVLIVLIVSCSASSNESQEQITAELVRIEQELLDAVAIADSSAWKKYLLDSCVIVVEDGSRSSKKEFIAGFAPLPPGYHGRINVINPKVFAQDNFAVISYVADEFENVYEQKLHTAYSVMNTYVKVDSGWRMAAMHAFEIPQNGPSVELEKSVLVQYAGVYELAKGVTYTVTLEGDSLMGQRTGRPKERLLAETETIFFRKGSTRGVKIFVKNKNGEVIEMRDRRNANDIVWKKLE